MPAQITRVMEGNLHVVVIKIHRNLSRANQLVDELCMMDDCVMATKRWIFILDRMQTMWTSCHDSLRLDFIQYLNIRRGEPKENIFASRAASGISIALFVLSEYREIHSCRIQNFCERLRGLLGAGVRRGGASDPPQNLRFRILFNCWDIESLRPFHAV